MQGKVFTDLLTDRNTDMCTRKMFDLLLTKDTFVINVWASYKLDLPRKVKVG